MFQLHLNTIIVDTILTKPVGHAAEMLRRDMKKILLTSDHKKNEIVLQYMESAEEESYEIKVTETKMTIQAADDLGFIYGLLRISREYLGVQPFWFWMNQQFAGKESVSIPLVTLKSPERIVRFRGWFFNDEVLMMKWAYNRNGVDGWKMCFEALLRCGGNMTIPGTDKMSRINRSLASEMGLWITHHHAEPLGAEMFVRAYPDVEPNFMDHADLFYKLWEDAVIEQKDCKVVWNLCFRGQGDKPFWSSDTTGQFDTPEKQGNLISELIKKQCEIVQKYVKNPVFCTNLYGEIMELYKEGYIELDPAIIKVRADNGFGRMVTRRRGNHCVRVSSMPEKQGGAQGIYYHVSFYDLQAANHITMLPNSVDFVDRELSQVMENGGDDFWVVNCSNVRPHVYYLDVVRKKWYGMHVTDTQQAKEFARDYYHGNDAIAACYQKYPQVMLAYGEQEDEHCGEQFYTENVRILGGQWLVDRTQNATPLYWVAGQGSLLEQAKKIKEICENGIRKLVLFKEECQQVSASLQGEEKLLFDATLLLQAQIHCNCAQGVISFVKGLEAFERKDYVRSFIALGNASELLDKTDEIMRNAEYEQWQDFYFNECFADIKHTAYVIRKVMGIVREYGDNVSHDKWYREYCYAKEDQGVCLLQVTDNHMTDWQLYQVMKEKN